MAGKYMPVPEGGGPQFFIGPDGRKYPIALLPLFRGLQNAEMQQHPGRFGIDTGGTITRPTPGGYYGMSGAERNAMRMQQAQALFMRNNPWANPDDPRNQPGYYNENGVHWLSRDETGRMA